MKGGGTLQDVGAGGKDGNGDASGSSNIVSASDTTPPDLYPSAYIYNDGAYLFYRLRLDSSPAGGGGQGILLQFGWGIEIDSNQNPDNYEWLLMVDGIASPETVNLQKNTSQGNLGDPSDVAEITVASYPLPGNHRIVVADSSINGDQDYFLDFRIPYNVFLAATGLGPDSMIRYFAGTSKSANNLTNNGADLLGGSDLYNGLGDYITPGGGTAPCGGFTNGTVMFVNALDGFIDQQLFSPGNPIYIRVDDADQTLARNPSQTLTVKVTTPRGDVEYVSLNATGVAGKFSGQLATRQGAVSARSNVLDLPSADEIVTVIYVDAITLNCQQNINRTDSLLSTNTKTDLHVSKSVSNTTPTPNSAITYTLVVTNNGPLVATNFTVTDVQPANIIFGAVTPPGTTGWSFSGGVGTWAVPSLASGASLSLSIPATVSGGASGTIANSAKINYGNDGEPSNDIGTATINVLGTDLRITKSVSNPTPAIGEQISYSVRAFNLGPNAASGVVVSDLLPTAHVTYVSHTMSGGAFTDAISPFDGVPDTWSIGNLPVGTGVTLDIFATVNASSAGSIVVNTAKLETGSLGQPDINSGNNSASASFLADPVDLQVTKTASNYGPSQNGSTTYTITVKNNGPNLASGVTLRDILPAGVSYQSHTVSQGTFTDNIAPAGIPETWAIGSLATNASATLTITAQVTAASGTTIRNEASIFALDQYDTNTANNKAIAVIAVGGTDLRVTKQSRKVATPPGTYAATTLVQPGNQVEFLITATNLGPTQATNVEVTDILPAGVSYVSSSASQGSYDGGNNGTKVWAIGTVDVNGSATLTILATVANGATGTITNVAMLTRSDQPDTDSTNNIGDTKLVVNATDLRITKDVDFTTPTIGQDITYILTVTNLGPMTATNVRVTDFLPPELTYKSSNPSQGSFTDLVAPLNGVPDTWTIGTINFSNNPTSDKATLTITATVKGYDANLRIKNQAQISSADQGDPDTTNNTDTRLIVVQGTDITVWKTASTPTPQEGFDFLYTVTVTNAGIFTATNLEIEDLIPASLTISSITPSTGAYLSGLWYIPSLNNGATASLQIAAKPKAGTAGSTIINTARVNYLDQIDSNTTNDTSSVSVVPQAAAANLTLVKMASSANVNPGQTITYTLIAVNGGSTAASGVEFDDHMSPFTAWSLNAYGAGQPFQPEDSNPASGLTIGTPVYSDDNGSTWTYTPVSGGGGAPAGFDANVTNWKIPMSGTMRAGGSITLRYQTQVK